MGRGKDCERVTQQALLPYDRIPNRLFSNKYGPYTLHFAETYHR
jgi:hypothetical protein